jgi:type I restriction enzyme M protein
MSYFKLILELLDQLRGAGAAAFEDALLFSLQVLAWIKLSDQQQVPASLLYQSSALPRTMHEVQEVFQRLASNQKISSNFNAFDYLPESIKHVRPSVLQRFFAVIKQYEAPGAIAAADLADFIAGLSSVREPRARGIAKEIADLMIGLARLEIDQEVYLPLEADGQLAYRARVLTPRTYPTSWHYSLLPHLINILGDTDVQVAVGDELAAPLFVEDGRLRQFATTIALLPFGLRVSEELAHRDSYGRFLEPTTSFPVLAIQHICAATQQRAVIGVPNGILFSPGAEHALRTTLLKSQVVEGVIALPPALLSGSAVPFSLLVLNLAEPQSEILFVDGTRPDFFERDGKGRNVLQGWQELRDLFLAGQAGPFTRLVAATEVLRNGTNLQPARYCLDAELQATQQLLAAYATRPLGEIAQVVRPAVLAEKNGTQPLAEVGPSDFPTFGYLQTAGRSILTSETLLTKADKRQQLLQAHDILITMKGTVGKVALVKPQATTWTAGLACLMLRTDAAHLDARVLFTFLKSAAGQGLLRQIVSAGSTVPLIQLRDLVKLPVPIPPLVEQQAIIADFERLVDLEQQVVHLREQQAALAGNFWTHPPV